MSRDEGMRIVGTIRSIELHAVGSKFQGIAPRHVARILLDVEHAVDGAGDEITAENLAGMPFQGPAELVPRYACGERVQITTTSAGNMHIASIKPAPLS